MIFRYIFVTWSLIPFIINAYAFTKLHHPIPDYTKKVYWQRFHQVLKQNTKYIYSKSNIPQLGNPLPIHLILSFKKKEFFFKLWNESTTPQKPILTQRIFCEYKAVSANIVYEACPTKELNKKWLKSKCPQNIGFHQNIKFFPSIDQCWSSGEHHIIALQKRHIRSLKSTWGQVIDVVISEFNTAPAFLEWHTKEKELMLHYR